jgi:hypothetical protein
MCIHISVECNLHINNKTVQRKALQFLCNFTDQQTASGHFLTSQLPPESRDQSADADGQGNSSKQVKAGDTSGLETMKLVIIN